MVLCLFFFKTSFIKVSNWVTLSSLCQTSVIVEFRVQDDVLSVTATTPSWNINCCPILYIIVLMNACFVIWFLLFLLFLLLLFVLF